MTATTKNRSGKKIPRKEKGEAESSKSLALRTVETQPATKPSAVPALGLWERDSFSSTALYDITDRALHAEIARFTLGLSPRALMAAYLDWVTGLAFSPGKRAQLVDKAWRKTIRFAHFGATRLVNPLEPTCCIEPLPQDRRFAGEAWQHFPFALIYQSFLLTQQWWHNATSGVEGVSSEHEQAVEFAARQWLDIFSPSNFILTNPEILQRTFEQGGLNLLRGYQNFVEDWQRAVSGQKPEGTENYAVGRDVAITPGKVIYRNRLIELIQYEPATDAVSAEPILIVPAWIMKYYILDLSPSNSLVRYLVNKGHTVFMISWKNPGPEDREIGMDDYRRLGVMDALDAVSQIVPKQQIHGVGYCLGGTLLAIAAAAMARNGDERFKTLTFLAAQVDFEAAGELMLFINDQQVSFLEDMMWEQGFLDTQQMAGAFQLLRSNDLIWSKIIHDYLMGERKPMIDLMAWNADATRMPYRMHSEYLRSLFLKNDLAEGRYRVGDRPIALTDIHVPVFAVGAEKDHVAPWHSVYKLNLFSDTEVTFLLTSGGHNAGIVNEPGHPNRHYRCATKREGERYLAPEEWYTTTEKSDGSWWPTWVAWLADHSSGRVQPPDVGKASAGYVSLCPAPGLYVLED